MDLGTIEKKLNADEYRSINDFRSDVNLTFDNCMTYHENGSILHDMTEKLKTKFESDCRLVEHSSMQSDGPDLIFEFVASNTNFLGVIPLLPPRCCALLT